MIQAMLDRLPANELGKSIKSVNFHVEQLTQEAVLRIIVKPVAKNFGEFCSALGCFVGLFEHLAEVRNATGCAGLESFVFHQLLTRYSFPPHICSGDPE